MTMFNHAGPAMLTTATTWGVGGPEFLTGYGVACLVFAAGIGVAWMALLGPRDPGDDAMPDLGLYELAMLGDGPQLAITSAAAQLHRDGLIKAGLAAGTLEVVGELDPDADPVERAVFEILRDEPGISAHAMRTRANDSDAVQSMASELTDAGLLVPLERVTALARTTLLVGGLLALLGIVRIAAKAIDGGPVGWLVAMVAVEVVGTLWLTGAVPTATARGRAALWRWRDAHDDLRRNPIGAESALVAALFGGAALWLAAPELASALGVEREATSSGGGGGGGGCGGGCGGCGGCG
jgi:uncharacterized protein (TIGR04222 family)